MKSLKLIVMLLTVLSVSNVLYCQITDKSGKQFKIQNSKVKTGYLNNQSLSNAELVNVYRYLVELQKVRSDYAIELKKNLLLNQQNSAYQNQIELQSDMMRNLEVYAEQVKPEWWQSEYAIVAWIVGAVTLTYLVTK